MGKNKRRDDDDVMVLGVSAGLDRGMEGQREDEVFMRSSCWGEAGRQASRAVKQQPVNSSLTRT